jgi:hypothetical protein
MPFTAAEIVLFFDDQAYMALSNRTTTALAAEGIAVLDDLSEYDKEGMGNIYRNLRKPAKVLCAGVAGAGGELQEVQAFNLSAKSQIRLTIGAVIAKFYEDIGCPLNPENMKWTVLKRINEQHKALLARKIGDSSYVSPKLTKTFLTYKWLESFFLCLRQKVGVHNFSPRVCCL